MNVRNYLSWCKNELILGMIRLKSRWIRLVRKNHRCVYFIATPTHGNLGDHAIVLAQYEMMKKIGAEENVIEISRWRYERNRKRLTGIIKPKDLIIIDGGGNIGTLWPQEEYKMRDIICRFPDNPIFIFPQTAFFSEDETGRQELEQSVAVYSAHKKLTVFCRDQHTYQLFCERFPMVKSFFTPDIVPYLCPALPEKERKNILFCCRTDREKTVSEEFTSKLAARFQNLRYTVAMTSTLLPYGVDRKSRQKALTEKWDEFSQARLVITDRLHGMVFAAITGTPCVALDNISHKVKEGYQWLQYLPYIRYCTTEKEALDSINFLLDQNGRTQYTNAPLRKDYELIENAVNAAMQTE